MHFQKCPLSQFVLWSCFLCALPFGLSFSVESDTCNTLPIVTKSDTAKSIGLPFELSLQWDCSSSLATVVNLFSIDIDCGPYHTNVVKRVVFIPLLTEMYHFEVESSISLPCFSECLLNLACFSNAMNLVNFSKSFRTPPTAPILPPTIDKLDIKNGQASLYWKAFQNISCGPIVEIQVRSSSGVAIYHHESGLVSPTKFSLSQLGLSTDSNQLPKEVNISMKFFNDISSSDWSTWHSTHIVPVVVASTAADRSSTLGLTAAALGILSVLAVTIVSFSICFMVYRATKRKSEQRARTAAHLSLQQENLSTCGRSEQSTSYDRCSLHSQDDKFECGSNLSDDKNPLCDSNSATTSPLMDNSEPKDFALA